MDKPGRSRVLRFWEAHRSIPGPQGEHAAQILKRGPLDVALSIPRHPTQQTPPHVQDEIYFIIRGRALFFTTASRTEVGSGDLVFVAAGAEHQFENYSEDFAVGGVFYGPDGGELPA